MNKVSILAAGFWFFGVIAQSVGLSATESSWASRMGISFEGESAMIREIKCLSFAHVIDRRKGGLRARDVVLRVNERRVGNRIDFEKGCVEAAKGAEAWYFLVERGGKKVKITPDPYLPCDPYTLNECGDAPEEMECAD